MLLLLLITVIAAGGLAMHWWTAKDALLAKAVEEKLEEILPDCDAAFQAVRLLDGGQVELVHLSLRSRINGALLVQIPRVMVKLDASLLRAHRQIVIQNVTLHSPEVIALRGSDGRWSWVGISPPQHSDSSSPHWEIRDGSLRIGFESTPGGPVQTVTGQGIDLRLRPQAHRRYALTGQAALQGVGSVNLHGFVDGNQGEWQLSGEAGEIRIDDALLTLAGRFSPELERQVADLRGGTPSFALAGGAGRGADPVRIAALSDAVPLQGLADSGHGGPTSSLMRADMKLAFQLGRNRHQTEIDYRLAGEVKHGQISELLLPIPLYELEGKFEVTPHRIRIEKMQAANNGSSVFVDGAAVRVGEEWTNSFQVKATQLQLDERVRAFLSPSLTKVYDMLRPTGSFDLDVDISHEPGQPPDVRLRTFTAIEMRVLCDYFQYPVDRIRGEIRQEGEMFHVAFTGSAGDKPVTATGVFYAGENDNVRLNVTANDIPIDARLIQAFQRPEQHRVRDVLESLRPGGLVSCQATIVRDQRTHDEFEIILNGQVQDGHMNFVEFPYEVEQLSGTFAYNPLEREVWLFDNLQGRHGAARISGRGLFDLEGDPGGLALELELVRIPIDHELEKATVTAVPGLATVWKDFGLGGNVDVKRVQIFWRPQEEVQVHLSNILWNEGTLMPSTVPYPWRNVTGVLDWDGSKLRIHSLQGWHGDTYFQIDGSQPDRPAFVQSNVSPSLAWRFHCENLKIMALNPDEELRRALPPPLSDALRAVDLQNRVSLDIGLDLKGWNGEESPVTARWKCLVGFRDNALVAGMPLKQVTGKAKSSGAWDGRQLYLDGYVELETLTALDLRFQNVRGPFKMEGDRLTFGTPSFDGRATRHDAGNPYAGKQLQSELYSGQVGLDLEVLLPEQGRNPIYQLDLSVQDVELAEWAADWSIQSQRLMGKINANAQIQGRGVIATSTTGKGWVQVTPAALYELPVFYQMFSLINFRPPDNNNTAFNYAYGDFTLHDGMFDFSTIELVGDALSLKGRGTVGYAGAEKSALNLDFYSKANNRIPFFRPVIERFGSNWIRVQVVGTVSKPTPLIQPRIGPLDDAFRSFMDAVEGGQLRTAPARNPARSSIP